MAFSIAAKLELSVALPSGQRIVAVRDKAEVAFMKFQDLIGQPKFIDSISQCEDDGYVSLIAASNSGPEAIDHAYKLQGFRAEPANFFIRLERLLAQLRVYRVHELCLSESNGNMSLIFSYWGFNAESD